MLGLDQRLFADLGCRQLAGGNLRVNERPAYAPLGAEFIDSHHRCGPWFSRGCFRHAPPLCAVDRRKSRFNKSQRLTLPRALAVLLGRGDLFKVTSGGDTFSDDAARV
jgi:hypothetical protein